MPVITTRAARPGETLSTLDGVERELGPQDIALLDAAGILSLGGLIGGAETGIDESTRTVLLEAANWSATHIRRTMQAQKVSTDAGVRFSRGVHPAPGAGGGASGHRADAAQRRRGDRGRASSTSICCRRRRRS